MELVHSVKISTVSLLYQRPWLQFFLVIEENWRARHFCVKHLQAIDGMQDECEQIQSHVTEDP